MTDDVSEQPCGRCGRSASWCIAETYWFADNDLWNEVNGSPNGFLCPPCFTTAAEAKGIAVGWRADRVGVIEKDDALASRSVSGEDPGQRG